MTFTLGKEYGSIESHELQQPVVRQQKLCQGPAVRGVVILGLCFVVMCAVFSSRRSSQLDLASLELVNSTDVAVVKEWNKNEKEAEMKQRNSLYQQIKDARSNFQSSKKLEAQKEQAEQAQVKDMFAKNEQKIKQQFDALQKNLTASVKQKETVLNNQAAELAKELAQKRANLSAALRQWLREHDSLKRALEDERLEEQHTKQQLEATDHNQLAQALSQNAAELNKKLLSAKQAKEQLLQAQHTSTLNLEHQGSSTLQDLWRKQQAELQALKTKEHQEEEQAKAEAEKYSENATLVKQQEQQEVAAIEKSLAAQKGQLEQIHDQLLEQLQQLKNEVNAVKQQVNVQMAKVAAAELTHNTTAEAAAQATESLLQKQLSELQGERGTIEQQLHGIPAQAKADESSAWNKLKELHATEQQKLKELETLAQNLLRQTRKHVQNETATLVAKQKADVFNQQEQQRQARDQLWNSQEEARDALAEQYKQAIQKLKAEEAQRLQQLRGAQHTQESEEIAAAQKRRADLATQFNSLQQEKEALSSGLQEVKAEQQDEQAKLHTSIRTELQQLKNQLAALKKQQAAAISKLRDSEQQEWQALEATEAKERKDVELKYGHEIAQQKAALKKEKQVEAARRNEYHQRLEAARHQQRAA